MRFAVLMALVASSEAVQLDQFRQAEPQDEIKQINNQAAAAEKALDNARSYEDIDKASASAAE